MLDKAVASCYFHYMYFIDWLMTVGCTLIIIAFIIYVACQSKKKDFKTQFEGRIFLVKQANDPSYKKYAVELERDDGKISRLNTAQKLAEKSRYRISFDKSGAFVFEKVEASG